VIKFHVARPQTPAEFEDYFDLRWRILRAPWHQPRGSEKDEFEETAEHISIITTEGRTIGVGRLHTLKPDQAQIRYMAVDGEYRGQGIGEIIFRHLEFLARDRNIKRILVNARNSAVGYYERFGFSVIGDGPTLFDEIQHKLMEKKL
jgi:N-acetylglutamate synthase-like GNAT family acetyltransferase